MSLADELLADLEALDEEDEDQKMYDEESLPSDRLPHTSRNSNYLGPQPMDCDLADLDDLPKVKQESSGEEEASDSDFKNVKTEGRGRTLEKSNDVSSVAKLLNSTKMKTVREQINYFQRKREQETDANGEPLIKIELGGPVEEDPEYQLVVQANDLAVSIDDEILLIHKYIRDHYAPRFAELESLVLNALDYARAVRAIGNEMDLTTINLASILPAATVMVVTVTSSTTTGQPLPDTELKRVEEACDMMMELDAVKRMILEYVESRMSFTAPNLSAIVGSYTAARLMGAAGGLTALSKMPSCNVQVLGKTNKAASGFSSVTQNRHAGFIAYSELVAIRTPPDLRAKMNRLVAAKCTLAARIDRCHESPGGEIGRKLREEIDAKLDKWQEPPPSKSVKALPAPDDAPKKRRGGRRARALKESYAVTELRKQQNRLAFGAEEAEVGGSTGSTRGLGLLGQSMNGSGKVRAAVVDTRTKAKSGAKTPKAWSGGATSFSATTGGFTTSLAFTPIQGIELSNPEAAKERVREANERWFGAGAFLKVSKDAAKKMEK